MNVPYHLMPHIATVEQPIADGGFTQDDTGQTLVTTLDEGVELPCRITPLSGSEAIEMGSQALGQITYSGLFPAPAPLASDFGLTDFHIKAGARVSVTTGSVEVVYRVIGPATIQWAGADQILQRVVLETDNQEVEPQ
jgi:hypothetical protein